MGLRDTVQRMYLQGLEDESLVMEVTKRKFGGNVRKSTKNEDMKEHIDFWWISDNGNEYGFDVKGVKKNKRTDKVGDDKINWIELINVQGNPGWVYGNAKYIAFLTNESILYVPRKKLTSYIEEKIKGKPLSTVNPSSCYIPYQRYGRMDMIVKVPTSDLKEIAKHEIMLE